MVKRRTRSILEEISKINVNKDKDHMIETRAMNMIAGVTNLVTLIEDTYDEEVAQDLTKRLINAIRTQDPKKFERGIRKVESYKNSKN